MKQLFEVGFDNLQKYSYFTSSYAQNKCVFDIFFFICQLRHIFYILIGSVGLRRYNDKK